MINQLIKKYGLPPISKIKYSENVNDIIERYVVTIPLHEGFDTILNRTISKAILEVKFGPLEYNQPNKILNYELEIVYEGIINNSDTIDSGINMFLPH